MLESNLAKHLTDEMWGKALEAASAATNGKVAEMEAPKTLQQGCATSLVAALDPAIEGMLFLVSLCSQSLSLIISNRTIWELPPRLCC